MCKQTDSVSMYQLLTGRWSKFKANFFSFFGEVDVKERKKNVRAVNMRTLLTGQVWSIKDFLIYDRKENFFLSSGSQSERRIQIILSSRRFSHIISQVIERFQSRGQQPWKEKSNETN